MEKEYIERNELIENLNRFAPEHYNALINQLITKQPTADVVEMKYGEWIWNTENKYKCSHCHYTTRVDEVMGLPQYRYCPNCGAKMSVNYESNKNES